MRLVKRETGKKKIMMMMQLRYQIECDDCDHCYILCESYIPDGKKWIQRHNTDTGHLSYSVVMKKGVDM